MNIKKISRRSLLTVSSTAIALPWLEYYAGPRPVWSAPDPGFTRDGLPKRICIVYNELGTIPKEWVSGPENNFQLGPILRPLQAHRDKMTIIEGLSQVKNGPGVHHSADLAALTAFSNIAKNDRGAGGISFDQRIANEIGQHTNRRSIQLAFGDMNSHISHRGRGQPIAPVKNPYSAFDDFFRGVTAGGSQPAAGSGGVNAVDHMAEGRKRIVMQMQEFYNQFNTRLGVSDRLRMETHIEAIDELVRRLDLNAAAGSSGNMMNASTSRGAVCSRPTLGVHNRLPNRGGNFLPEGFNRNRIYEDISATSSHSLKNDDIMKTWFDIIAHSFSCGVTSVCTIKAGFLQDHNSHSHVANVNNRNSSPRAYDVVVNAGVQTARRIKYFVDKLESIPEGSGSVMDNTVILWVYALANGNAHNNFDSRYLLIGNAGDSFPLESGGRLLKYNKNDRKPHNPLLTSLINCFGIPDDNFGERRFHGEGRLSRLGVTV